MRASSCFVATELLASKVREPDLEVSYSTGGLAHAEKITTRSATYTFVLPDDSLILMPYDSDSALLHPHPPLIPAICRIVAYAVLLIRPSWVLSNHARDLKLQTVRCRNTEIPCSSMSYLVWTV